MQDTIIDAGILRETISCEEIKKIDHDILLKGMKTIQAGVIKKQIFLSNILFMLTNALVKTITNNGPKTYAIIEIKQNQLIINFNCYC